jgi:hypothetical protein
MFFKSWRARQDPSYNFALKDVSRATSAAETYFVRADITSVSGAKYSCVDGGTAINNPMIAAILEARAMWPSEKDLRFLSLGTGIRTTPIAPANDGISGWALDIVPLFQDSQGSVFHHLAEWAAPQLVRCDIELGAVNPAIDDASPGNIAALAALGRQLVTAEIDNALAVLEP